MKKDSLPHTSQDHDRKHQHDHITNNPRAAKELPNAEDDGDMTKKQENADLLAKGHIISNKPAQDAGFTEDKRTAARHEHTNHFTNREGKGEK